MAIIWNQKVEVKWGSRNSTKFLNLGYPKLDIGDTFLIPLKHVSPNAKIKVKAVCDNCGINYDGNFGTVNGSKNQFCTKVCSDNFKKGKIGNRTKPRHVKPCDNCSVEIEVEDYKFKRSRFHFCSRDCSNSFNRKDNYDYSHMNVIKCILECDACGEMLFKTKERLIKHPTKNHFCNQRCQGDFLKGKPNIKSRNRIDVNCYTCNKVFQLPPYRVKNQERNFCSKECHSKWRQTDEYINIMGLRERKKIDRIKVNCGSCGKEIERLPSEIRGFKNHYCNEECRKAGFVNNNPNPSKKKTEFRCSNCDNSVMKHESQVRGKEVFCCRDCYAEYRSNHIKGDMIYNYQNIIVECDQCGANTKTTPYNLEHRKNQFCSQNCYYKYRSIHYIGENHPHFGKKKTPEQIEKMREATIKRHQNGEFPQTKTKIHRLVSDLLHIKDIEHTNEYAIKYYSVDIFLNTHKLMIEIMGDYWHANPIIFNNFDKTHKIQRKSIKRDKSKISYIKKYHNTTPLYLWESDIENNFDKCEKLIELFIKNNGILEDFHSFNYDLFDEDLILFEDKEIPYFQRNQIVHQN